MRLVTFEFREAASTEQRLGALVREDHEVLDLTAMEVAAFASMQSLIDGGADALDRARQAVQDAVAGKCKTVPIGLVNLRAPLPRPPQMRDYGCFPEHFDRAMQALKRLKDRKSHPIRSPADFTWNSEVSLLPDDYYTLPRFYTMNNLLVAGPGDPIPWPEFSEFVDYELELGAILSKGGKDIGRDSAPGHIFGYTIFNDMTARDQQADEGRSYGKCKDFDNSNVIGPCIVTTDEITNPYDLKMTAHVNGELWSSGSTSSMVRTFADLIAFGSQSQTLRAGEFIASGTVGGGCGLEQGRFLNPGDLIELEIEGIGRLSNRIVRGGV